MKRETPKYRILYDKLRQEITSGSLSYGRKLPSKRVLAASYGLSIVTVEHAVELLEQEGYVTSIERSGVRVIYRAGELLETRGTGEHKAGPVTNKPEPVTDEGEGNTGSFPISVLAKAARKVISEREAELLIKPPGEGLRLFRTAVSDYLDRNRGIHALPEQIIIGSGSEYLYGLIVEAAFSAGVRDFGENYVQELNEKTAFLSERPEYADIHWHMIGHLQKNKVKYLAGKVALTHSVDTVGLAGQIEKESAKRDVTTDILLEVNVAREESKWGFSPEETPAAAREIAALPHVRLLGLMTSAPYTEDPESNRVYFRELKTLADALKEEGLIAGKDGVKTPVLSMGMTGDFEVAVEEGATMVRVGTAVFGARDYTKS